MHKIVKFISLVFKNYLPYLAKSILLDNLLLEFKNGSFTGRAPSDSPLPCSKVSPSTCPIVGCRLLVLRRHALSWLVLALVIESRLLAICWDLLNCCRCHISVSLWEPFRGLIHHFSALWVAQMHSDCVIRC